MGDGGLPGYPTQGHCHRLTFLEVGVNRAPHARRAEKKERERERVEGRAMVGSH